MASWNIAWLNADAGAGPVPRQHEDYERLRSYAAELDADIVALQEVDGEQAAGRVFDPNVYAFHFAAGGGAQRTGFAFRRSLEVTLHPDHAELARGNLRGGADLSVTTRGGRLRLLAVHLKSGCPSGGEHSAPTRSDACRKLAVQLPALEAWVDARAQEQVPFAVLGDFNRRWTSAHADWFFDDLDDASPPEADLDSPTRSQTVTCWTGAMPSVDHLVLSRQLQERVLPGSFETLRYRASDLPHRARLSDHCPILVGLRFD